MLEGLGAVPPLTASVRKDGYLMGRYSKGQLLFFADLSFGGQKKANVDLYFKIKSFPFSELWSLSFRELKIQLWKEELMSVKYSVLLSALIDILKGKQMRR